ncbi:hypothetical protein evm_012730 [Chilo suppressalis]|nr:hypothetical protein evm_012730 [Chilo suppressalis]
MHSSTQENLKLMRYRQELKMQSSTMNTFFLFFSLINLLYISYNTDDVVRAMRLGRVRQDKPRPLPVKLRSEAIRDNLWLAKKKLKGSGITMSEFLTKLRH